MKKIISLLMAVVFVFSMAVPSFAAVSANEAVQVNAISENDASSTNDIFSDIVDTLNGIINSIINFFKNLFGLGDEVGNYTITYYEDETKTIELYKESYAEGSEIGSVAVPTKPGYTFKGWMPELPSVMPAEDINVYATWSIKTYTITFNTGSVDAKVDKITAAYNQEVYIPDVENAEKYVLYGWYGSDKNYYTVGQRITLTQDLVLTAHWGNKITTITFDPNGGNWNGSYSNKYVSNEVGTTVNAPVDPVRPGYTFLGWDGVVPEKQPNEDITFTAVWEAKTITTG